MINYMIYDIEVFKEDWLVVIHDVTNNSTRVIHNDLKQVKDMFDAKDHKLFVGFNNKHYDDYIVLTMLAGGSNKLVKEHNDWIIGGKNPWEFKFIQYHKKPFYSSDLRDDLPINLSLKAIEANLGKSIVETGVPFDIDRALTKEELNLEIKYCSSDVLNTVRLFNERKNYLDAKLTVGNLKNFDPRYALSLTNAKLTAAFLEAKKQNHIDEFDYPINANLKIGKYQEVLDFFKDPISFEQKRLKAKLVKAKSERSKQSIKRQLKELITMYQTSLDTKVAGVPHTYAWGGLHGAVKNYFVKEDSEHTILTADVSSYYPSLMIQYQYLSRNVPNPKGFEDVYHQRIKAKNSGDKATAGALKLVLNTTYGASKNQFNELFDPRQANAICINGQLLLTDLIDKLEEIESFELIQTNTDGIIFRFKNEVADEIESTLEEWEHRTKMNMERTVMKVIAQKDVNNYVMKKGESYIFENGQKVVIDEDHDALKTKGSYVSLFKGGNFENRSLVVLNKALVDYFMNGIDPKETIENDQNALDFQMVAKTGSTYDKTVQVVDGNDVEVQKVNRVYASKDSAKGSLFKLKKNGRRDKISNLPEHCEIDNTNSIELSQIDKEFYIELANKRIADYVGKKGLNEVAASKKTVTKAKESNVSELNIYQKITNVRLEFLDEEIKKSGVNRFSEYKYFELEDIVPIANRLLAKYHLTANISFNHEVATLKVVDADSIVRDENHVIKSVDFEEFQSPMVELTAKGMNSIQAMGAVETYQRRYLYFLLLDVVEHDAIDSGNTAGQKKDPEFEKTTKVATTKVSKKPASATERKDAKEKITNADGEMTDVQKHSIVKGLKKLRAKDEKYEPFIAKVKTKIKGGLTQKQADKLLEKVGDKVAE